MKLVETNEAPQLKGWESFSDNPEETVSYPQAAALIPCSLRQARRLVASKRLEFIRTGKHRGVRIFVRSIREFREERKGLRSNES